MRVLLLLLSLSLLLPAPAMAKKKKDRPTRSDAERQIMTTHRAYAAAVLKMDWLGAAQYFAPDALTGIRETMEPFFAMDDGDGENVGSAMVGKTTEELAALSDAEFFGAFVQGVMAMSPGVADAMAGAQMLEKGVAFGEPGEAFVVYEMTMTSNGMGISKFAVTPMVRGQGGVWALKMTGEFKGMAEAFARMGKERDAQEEAEADGPPDGAVEDAVQGTRDENWGGTTRHDKPPAKGE